MYTILKGVRGPAKKKKKKKPKDQGKGKQNKALGDPSGTRNPGHPVQIRGRQPNRTKSQ